MTVTSLHFANIAVLRDQNEPDGFVLITVLAAMGPNCQCVVMCRSL